MPQSILRQARELNAFGGEFGAEDSSGFGRYADDHRQPSSKA